MRKIINEKNNNINYHENKKNKHLGNCYGKNRK